MDGFAQMFTAYLVLAYWRDYHATLQTEHNIPSTSIIYSLRDPMFMFRKKNPPCYSTDFRNDDSNNKVHQHGGKKKEEEYEPLFCASFV